jgi:predicted amidohydrolase
MTGKGSSMSGPNSSTFKVGLVQMRSGLDPAANLTSLITSIDEAKRNGADYVQTPEMTNILALKREHLFANIVAEEQDATLATLRELAQKLSIYIHIGSLALKISPDKAVNRGFVIDRKGNIAARYDKIHMFDVDLAGGESYRESANYRPGDVAVVADLPWGRLGLTICYDLRFPALYRALAEAGASFLAIPAAFTKQTGEAHWQVLMRARAIENGCYVIAAAPVGQGRCRRRHRARRDHGRDRPRRGRCGPIEGAVAESWPALRSGRADGRANLSSRSAECFMIRYTLSCERGHEFESWFANSEAYDKQAKRKLVTCPVCNSAKVEKAIMAPSLTSSLARTDIAEPSPPPAASPATPVKAPVAMMSPPERELRQKLKELRDHVTKNATNVGAKFPEEARKIHYGETEHRSIYGEASPEEAKALHEEGIEFHPLPMLPDDQN